MPSPPPYVPQVKIHWCFDLPRRRLTRMAQLQGVHPASWCLPQPHGPDPEPRPNPEPTLTLALTLTLPLWLTLTLTMPLIRYLAQLSAFLYTYYGSAYLPGTWRSCPPSSILTMALRTYQVPGAAVRLPLPAQS